MAKETGAVWQLIQDWMDALPYGKVSQRDLARAVGVSHTTITEWKHMESWTSVDKMQALARVLRVPENVVLLAFLADHGYDAMLPQRPGRRPEVVDPTQSS